MLPQFGNLTWRGSRGRLNSVQGVQNLPMYEMQIDGHTLVAAALNPDTPGQPIILLHGITASISFWEALDKYHPVFAKHGPCYALSLPGHYPAVAPADFCRRELTVEFLTSLLTAAILELPLRKQTVTLVGHSTGGFSALAIAASTPGIVSRVISLAGFVQGRWTGLLGTGQWFTRRGPIGRAIFKLGYGYSRMNRWFNRQFAHWYVADMDSFSAFPYVEPFLDDTYRNFKHLDLSVMAKYFKTMPDFDISEQLADIKAPTLAMTGDKDPIVPPAQSRLIAERVQGADFVKITGGGHLLFAENPAEYNQALDEWLQRTSS